MEAQPSLGKLVNLETKKELPFSLNPIEYTVSRGFEFQVEPRLGQSGPVVAFRCGGAATLNFELLFDKDADTKCDISKVESFLKELNKIPDATRTVAAVEFHMGSFSFKGFIQSYSLQKLRFDNKGEATSAKLSAGMISRGDYEAQS